MLASKDLLACGTRRNLVQRRSSDPRREHQHPSAIGATRWPTLGSPVGPFRLARAEGPAVSLGLGCVVGEEVGDCCGDEVVTRRGAKQYVKGENRCGELGCGL